MNVLQKVTWKALMKNKTRTWVTVIGIVLSAAMFTAVTTCASSLQNYMIQSVVAVEGGWHGRQYNINVPHITALKGNPKVRQYALFEKLGYAPIGSQNTHKPYLSVEAMDGAPEDMVPLHLTEGRMPQNSTELLIPDHLYQNGQVQLTLGQSLTLQLGDRLDPQTNQLLTQQKGYSEQEVFTPRESRTYTVVGFYERFPYIVEDYSAPGYTALTITDGKNCYPADAYVQMKDPWDIYDLLGDTKPHDSLLRTMGISLASSFNQVLYGLSAMLMGIILFGSVSLIYNAFSISVSERSKQFGILKTVGATKRQIKSSVYFEAVVLSAIGIPLGILAGIAGIAVTLHLTGEMFAVILPDSEVGLQLYVSPFSVLLAGGVAFVTVLLSARVPARRAITTNPIDAVRQTDEIRIQPKKVKSPRWVYKLFGFAGLLADKNIKRNRKKYRVTIFSLFMSVVLFVSASSFCGYLTDAATQVVEVRNYDLSYTFTEQAYTHQELEARLDTLQQIDSYISVAAHFGVVEINEADLDPRYLAKEDNRVGTNFYFINDSAFAQWAKEQGLDPSDYTDPRQVRGVGISRITEWNQEAQRYEQTDILAHKNVAYSFIHIPSEWEGYSLAGSEEQGDEEIFVYVNKEGQELRMPESSPAFFNTGMIGALVSQSPLGETNTELTLIFPMSMQSAVVKNAPITMRSYYFKTRDHQAAQQELILLLQQLPVEHAGVYDMRAAQESNRALVTVINVFSYGFIILISLIALANVFNTVSTNIALRRREFAMLRSVGMSERALRRMMNYECVLFGAKGLLWGLICSLGVTYLIYRVIVKGVALTFYIPWYSIVVAVASVFAVVFATMLYGMKKSRGEDPISALKNENL